MSMRYNSGPRGPKAGGIDIIHSAPLNRFLWTVSSVSAS